MANEPRLAIESIAGLRPYQEDEVLAEALSDGRVLVAVADGMGGHAAGEVASAIALEALIEAVQDGQSLADAFTLANSRVYAKAAEPGKQGMGTTLVAALIDGDEVQLANVGDSRGYVIATDGIRQLTEDHSFVAEAVKRGQSEAEAMAGPWKDALTRSIGTEEEVDVDVFGPLPVTDDSALLICSDGLYKTLSDEDLLRIYSQSGSPRGAAQSLVSSAFESGSDDNISVAIAEYGEVPRIVVGGTVPLDFVPSPEEVAAADAMAESAVEADLEASSGVSDEAMERMYSGDAEASEGGGPGEGPGETETSEQAAGLEPGFEKGRSFPIGAIVAAAVVIGALLVFIAFGG